MTWKIGLVMLIPGVILGVSSLFLFGTSISRAASQSRAANLEFAPGGERELRTVTVEPGMPVRIDFDAALELPEGILHDTGDRGEIRNFDIPVNYEIRDEWGETVHTAGGSLSGSAILPAGDSSHRDSFERKRECSYRGDRFLPPPSGEIIISAVIPGKDSNGYPITLCTAKVFHRLREEAAKLAIGGGVLLIAAIILSIIGFIVTFIGIILAAVK